jgi:hypothetical protein
VRSLRVETDRLGFSWPFARSLSVDHSCISVFVNLSFQRFIGASRAGETARSVDRGFHLNQFANVAIAHGDALVFELHARDLSLSLCIVHAELAASLRANFFLLVKAALLLVAFCLNDDLGGLLLLHFLSRLFHVFILVQTLDGAIVAGLPPINNVRVDSNRRLLIDGRLQSHAHLLLTSIRLSVPYSHEKNRHC